MECGFNRSRASAWTTPLPLPPGCPPLKPVGIIAADAAASVPAAVAVPITAVKAQAAADTFHAIVAAAAASPAAAASRAVVCVPGVGAEVG